jgi:hypothetical protein
MEPWLDHMEDLPWRPRGSSRPVAVADAPLNVDALDERYLSWGAAHNSLSGLAADDHPQYHNDARALAWLLANDGPGSGFDADTVDGLHASAFALASHTHAASDITSGVFGVNRGGTSFSGYAAGDMLYCSTTDVLSKLAAGTNGHVLTLVAGLPSWQAPAAAGVTGSGTTGKLPKWSSPNG